MSKIRDIVENNESPRGKIFDYSIQAIIIVSLVSFSIETIPSLPPALIYFVSLIEKLTIFIFTCEYLLRVILSKRKVKFILSISGLIDLIAIMPFYLSLGIDLRSLRAIRLVRLLRALKFLRYSKTLRYFRQAAREIKAELILYTAITLLLLYFSAVAVYFFEHEAQPDQFSSVFHSLWWAIATLTTVGYGDIYPVTVLGKIFTSLLIIIGIAVVAIPAGMMASALGKAHEQNIMSRGLGGKRVEFRKKAIRKGFRRKKSK